MPPSRDLLERWQVLVYASAIGAGALCSLALPAATAWLSAALWPLLGVLLSVTFVQMPSGPGETLRNGRRALAALLLGNFVAVPLLVGLLSQLVPADPAVRLGFFLVLLVPCTDWFVTFTHLGRGNARLALSATPVLLVLQMALLPLWLWAFLGREALVGMQAPPFVLAFVTLLLLPLVAARLTRHLVTQRDLPLLSRVVDASAWLPIPLLALVLFGVTASELDGVLDKLPRLGVVPVLFAAYLGAVPLLAALVNRLLHVSGAAARTVTFSLATRNSFVVLPLALAWPHDSSLAASVIVLQSLVELCGMVVYLWIIPRLPFAAPPAEPAIPA